MILNTLLTIHTTRSKFITWKNIFLRFVFIDTIYTKDFLTFCHLFWQALDFQLGKPLPIHFLRRFSKATSSNGSTISGSHHMMAKYFIELASIEYNLAKYSPSEVWKHFI